MPGLHASESSAALWAVYWGLIEEARAAAVWRHEEDGQLRPDGRRRPPRFVAVVEEARHLERLAARAQEVAGLPGLWPLQVYAERWEWARVQVNDASHSQRLAAGVPAVVGAVERGQVAAALEVLERLRAAGHAGRVAQEDGQQFLEVVPGPDGLTVRKGHGRAFRLRAWGHDGQLLRDKLSVGAVVVAGVEHIEDATGRRRKERADRLERLATWEGLTLFQPPAGAGKGRAASAVLPVDEVPLFSAEQLTGSAALPSRIEQLRLVFNRQRPAPKNLSGTARKVLEAVAGGGFLVSDHNRWKLLEADGQARNVDPRTVARLRSEGLVIPSEG